ncbi:LysE family translocator [Desulfurobacterium atlanticum]|uniref:Threonine/homoserine/homoserine lactone efflux protein n=1 Tax=Desulfurobacterium atlanticum TaxID=240169 RepID=A0A238YKR0_9BACT|nr:LysE family translocator [Desulfurobacterium atlanticum]SNR70999.1 Threonine/homoserine/homoserine lactone efflux protein [Desulfurobacterium atlanticum]
MIETAISLFVIWTLLLLTPGPDFVLVLRNTINGGFKEGFSTNLGITAGLTIHTTTAILGIAILSQNPLLFKIVKTIGALYIIYIGISGLLSIKKASGIKIEKTEKQFNSIKEGFFCNILNPKLPLILLGVFTQLIPPETSIPVKFLFGFEIVITSFVMWNVVALIFGNKRVLPKLQSFEKEITVIANFVLIFLGTYELLKG